jgi:Icc protein
MPIHLAPISRRNFLSRTFTAGAALTLAPQLFAAGRKTDPNYWALFSDIHLAADTAFKARGVCMADHFKAVTDEFLAMPKRPAGLFINGDCAFDTGEKGDYAAVVNALAPICADDVPIHLTLGNHDNRERFWDAFEEEKAARRPVEDRQMGLVQSPKANWYILDSLEKTKAVPGLLGEAQLNWLAQALDANSKKPALVMIHHDPGKDAKSSLKDTEALFEIIRPRKQVKAYIYGHTHTWKMEKDPSGIHLINLPPVAYVFQPGWPSGWVQAHLEKNQLNLELRCIDRKHPSHGETAALKWRA